MSGVKGITHARGRCPACGRVVAGGVMADTGKVCLRNHNRAPGVECDVTLGQRYVDGVWEETTPLRSGRGAGTPLRTGWGRAYAAQNPQPGTSGGAAESVAAERRVRRG